MAGGSLLASLRVSGFFAAVWLVGKFAGLLGVSSIVFEIGIGLLLAPTLLELGGKPGTSSILPPVYAKCQHRRNSIFGVEQDLFEYYCHPDEATKALGDSHHHLVHMIHHVDLCKDEIAACGQGECLSDGYINYKEVTGSLLDVEADLVDCLVTECDKEIAHLCGQEPDVFTLIGHTGVAMMIFESGMHFDFEKSRKVGPKACIVAILGTFLPLVSGTVIIMLIPGNYDFYNGFSAGVALAPTSVGIALKLLLEAKCLQYDFGQAIITAAFVDDILSLIIFNVLFSITAPGGFDIITCVVFPVLGCIFMAGGGSLGISFWPQTIKRLYDKLPKASGEKTLSRYDEALLFILFALLIGYGTLTFFLGTHLWGCFVAGMSFASIHHAHHLWKQQTKRWTVWMLRIFFSCTVAFAIPIDKMLTVEAFGWGSVVGIAACILPKVVCAFFMGEARFVIGWAMVGRAEFAYLIAEMAKSGGIMNDDVFAIVIWALFYATIFAPFVFRYVLARYAKRIEDRDKAAAESEANLSHRKTEGKGWRVDATASMAAVQKNASLQSIAGPAESGQLRATADGHKLKYLNDEQMLRFMICYPSHQKDSDIRSVYDSLKQLQLRIVSVELEGDMNQHVQIFTVMAKPGETFLESQLEFVQETIFDAVDSAQVGAHLLWLPRGGASRGTSSKMVKVSITADLTESPNTSDNVHQALNSLQDLKLFPIRSSVQMFSRSLVATMIVAHKEALELDPRTPPSSPRYQGAQTKPKQRRQIEYAMSNLQLGAAELPDIGANANVALKKSIEKHMTDNGCKAFVHTEAMSFAMDPLGGPSHDAGSIVAAQVDAPVVEVKLAMHSMDFNIFPKLLKAIGQFNFSVLSARVDERMSSQIDIVISSPLLSQEGADRNLLDALEKVANQSFIDGSLDLVNLGDDDETTITRVIGSGKNVDAVQGKGKKKKGPWD